MAAWNVASWSHVGAGLQLNASAATVSSLVSDGATLYAGGAFTSSGGAAVTDVVAWNGSTWVGLPGANQISNALALYGGYPMATVTAGVAKPELWNGSTWQDLGAPALQPNAYGLDGTTLFAYG